MSDALIRLASWTQKDSYKSLEEALSVPAETWSAFLSGAGIDNYVVVTTCNRLEVYYSSDKEITDIPKGSTARLYSGNEAIDHLFRVTAGLESMSVGENEILHQVKEAFDIASEEDHAHGSLALIFRKAISSGKLVRRNTRISRGKVSVPALAVDILNRNHGISGKKIAVIGTGKMASDIIKYLQKLNPSEITIVGRNADKAASLASSFGYSWDSLAQLEALLDRNQVVITATSSKNLIIHREMLSASKERKIFLDISNPRNVDEPGDADNYALIDLKSLQPILERNRLGKKNEISSAESIVERQAELLKSGLSKLETEDLIASLYMHADELKEREISRLKKALAAGTDFDQALEAMSSALVKKLLAFQTEVLRNVHGSRVTGDIKAAMETAESKGESSDASGDSQDHRENRSQQDQTPQLSRTP